MNHAVGGRAAARGARSFGVVSYLPNLDGVGVIVSISGTNMEGTEATAEMLLSEERFQSLAERLDARDASALPFFEAVIRATSVAGAGSQPEIVAVRRTASN